MKKTLAALAALLVTVSAAGCSAAEPAASVETPSPSSSPTASEVSIWAVTATPTSLPSSAAKTAATCSTLFDPGRGLLFIKTIDAMAAIDHGDLSQTGAARSASEELGALHDQAAPELQNDIYELQMVMLKASLATDASHTLDLRRYGAAGVGLIKACPQVIARYKASIAATAQTYTPAEIQAAYQGEIEAAGVHPPNWADYTARMKAATCGAPPDGFAASIDPLLRVNDPSQAAQAISDTVGAFCPERRLDLAEALLSIQ